VHDACVPWGDAGCVSIGPWLKAVSEAEAAWRQLTDGSAPYWYEEVNCLAEGVGEATLVQVENDVARILHTRPLQGPQACVAAANRPTRFTPHTMGELLGACEDLVRREGRDVFVRRDIPGVLTGCMWSGPRGCSGACGDGFAIGSWAFGQASLQRPDSGAR
jgi:hypothetical protein